MGAARVVKSQADLLILRELLLLTERKALLAITEALAGPSPLRRIKFERLGCDPLDEHDAQNFAEQIDQHATYETAIDALALLMERHPRREWILSPGAHGRGHDIVSLDGEVAAEVFAAVHPSNNDKLRRDVDKVAAFSGRFRYVVYRAPNDAPHERELGGVVVIALGM